MVLPANGCYLCAPLVAHTVDEMVEQMHLAVAQGADIVELRIDHISNFHPSRDLPLLLHGRPLPVIVTYRYIYAMLNSVCFLSLYCDIHY